jgi:hypothetical protein
MPCVALGVCIPHAWPTPTMIGGPDDHLTGSRGQPTCAPLKQGEELHGRGVPSMPLCQFKNCGSNCLGTRDALFATISSCHKGTITAMLCQPLRALQHRAPVRCCHASTDRGALPLQLPRRKFRRAMWGKILAPPVGSWPRLRWARGPLSVLQFPFFQLGSVIIESVLVSMQS